MTDSNPNQRPDEGHQGERQSEKERQNPQHQQSEEERRRQQREQEQQGDMPGKDAPEKNR